MNTKIEQFKPENYDMIKSWWLFHKEPPADITMIPETSYLMYYNDQPILAVSMFLTNAPIAWIDNFIGSPTSKGSTRKECGKLLLNHLETIAKKENKKILFCMSKNDKTTKRYIELGFIKTLDNVSTFIKGVN